jgi:ABC-type transport system involved in cytochrome c biogenesis permease subunit
MPRILIILCLLIPCIATAQTQPGLRNPQPEPRNLSPDAGKILAPLAVQNEGRTKPLDSYARFNLLACYHQSKMGKISAADWLTQLLLDPDTAYEVKCFRIRNEDLLVDLGLPKRADGKHVYNFTELRKVIDDQRARVQAISARNKDEHTLIESQLLKLYSTVHGYFAISRSFTCLTPEIVINNAQLAQELNLPHGKPFSFFQLHQRWNTFRPLVDKLRNHYDDTNPYHLAIFKLASQLRDMQQRESRFASLTIIPPEDDPIHETWLTPWQVLDGQHNATEHEIKAMTELEAAITALIHNDNTTATQHITTLQSTSSDKVNALAKAELSYNRLDAFTNSVAFYLLGFLLLCFSWLFAGKQLRWASWSVVLIGLLLHSAGIILRMYIRGRPAPVTNIYESVIYVGFTCVLIGLIIEFIRRDGLGLLIALVPGIILHFVGFKYALDGDTMGRLVAVLDSNFWLSTHVVTITHGYGFASAAALIANSYLFIRLFTPNKKSLHQSISKAFTGITLFALLLCIVGTILGGIWGDQSWGRFWGWDPKENGALLICLWLLIVLHGKWGKQLKDLGIATMLSLTNITVLLAWFGVNLLGVGLHNYGFTEGAARNLAIACGAIFLLTIIPSAIIFLRDAAKAKAKAKA